MKFDPNNVYHRITVYLAILMTAFLSVYKFGIYGLVAVFVFTGIMIVLIVAAYNYLLNDTFDDF